MEIYSSIVGFFQNGGMFMYPIVLVLAAGLAIAIERFMFLSATQPRVNHLGKEWIRLIKEGRFNKAAGLKRR